MLSNQKTLLIVLPKRTTLKVLSVYYEDKTGKKVESGLLQGGRVPCSLSQLLPTQPQHLGP